MFSFQEENPSNVIHKLYFGWKMSYSNNVQTSKCKKISKLIPWKLIQFAVKDLGLTVLDIFTDIYQAYDYFQQSQ